MTENDFQRLRDFIEYYTTVNGIPPYCIMVSIKDHQDLIRMTGESITIAVYYSYVANNCAYLLTQKELDNCPESVGL